jgi:hypothetical protein
MNEEYMQIYSNGSTILILQSSYSAYNIASIIKKERQYIILFL